MNILISRCWPELVIGVFFYGGLWFTVQHLVTTRHPVLLTAGSFGGRTLITLGAFSVRAGSGVAERARRALAGFAIGARVWSRHYRRKGRQPRCT